jgi:hypothetical protein
MVNGAERTGYNSDGAQSDTSRKFRSIPVTGRIICGNRYSASGMGLRKWNMSFQSCSVAGREMSNSG